MFWCSRKGRNKTPEKKLCKIINGRRSTEKRTRWKYKKVAHLHIDTISEDCEHWPKREKLEIVNVIL